MIQLDRQESRVLGVLIEKALTTPAQYPITLNALTSGCNQKSNRDPVVNYTEDQVQSTLDRLRVKGLVTIVDMAGSRVLKYRHNAREALGVETMNLVVLSELLLRGPQTLGELRTRGSRMRPIESLEMAQGIVAALLEHDPPLIKRLPPAPGSRAERYVQRLCPDLHPLDAPPAAAGAAAPAGGDATALAEAVAKQDELLDRIDALERNLAAVRACVERLATSLGEPGPE
jgi:hypothetical protein